MAQKYISKKSEDYALVDKHTGELLDYYQTRKLTIEKFIYVYLTSVPELAKLTGMELKILALCWLTSDFGNAETGNVVHNNASFKIEAQKHIPGISDSSIDVTFGKLVKKNMLRRVCKGEYQLNSDYFFKGKLSDRSKLAYKIIVNPKDLKKTKDGSSYCFFTRSVEIVNIDEENIDLGQSK